MVNMGNPHVVIFVEDRARAEDREQPRAQAHKSQTRGAQQQQQQQALAIEKRLQPLRRVPVRALGPLIERHPAFPARVNVHWAQVLSRTEVAMRTWERGAGT